jgi:hypothetical protein
VYLPRYSFSAHVIKTPVTFCVVYTLEEGVREVAGTARLSVYDGGEYISLVS